MNTLEAFQMRCQRQILDVCWWVHVSNADVLQRSGLSTIGGILRNWRLSLFGHAARLDPRVPAHDALRLMVDTYEGRKASWRRPPDHPRNVWLNKIQEDAGPDLRGGGCRPPTNRGPSTKPVIFYLSFMLCLQNWPTHSLQKTEDVLILNP